MAVEIQDGVKTQINGIFENIENKESYGCNQKVILPRTKYETVTLHIDCLIITEIVKNDLHISIKFISPDNLEDGIVNDVLLSSSCWYNHEDKQIQKLLKQTIDKKIILLNKILMYCDKNISSFLDYKKFIKNLQYPQVIFHKDLLKLFNEETLSRILVKSKLTPRPKLNYNFYNNKLNEDKLFIYEFKGFIHYGKDENSYGVGLDYRESLPILYKSIERIGYISCESFLERLGI